MRSGGCLSPDSDAWNATIPSRRLTWWLRQRVEYRVGSVAGIDAETVIPTRSPRYAFAAPKITASKIPRIKAVTVNPEPPGPQKYTV